MRRLWKILIGVFAVLVVLVGGGIAYILNIDANAYKADIEEAVAEETGRQLTIGGPIELDIGAETVLQLSDVSFANAEWGARPQMATVENFEVALRLMPTIFGTPDITRVRLSGVQVLIERNAEGVTNTEFRKPGADADGERAEEQEAEPSAPEAPDGVDLTIPVLRDVRIEDITVVARDHQAGTENTVRINRLTLAGEGPESPLALDLDGSFDDLPLIMAGELGSPATMLDSGRPWPLDVAGNLAGVDVALNGSIMEPTAGRGIDLHATALGQEVATVARKVGVDVPKIGPFEVRADLHGDSDGDLAVENLIVDVGTKEFAHLKVEGRVASATRASGLDLSALVEGTETGRLSALTERFAGQSVPALGAYRLAARVTGGLEKGVSVTGIDAAVGEGETLRATAKGSIADALTAGGLDMTVTAKSGQIARLNALVGPYTDQEIPALGPLDLSARLVGDLPRGGASGGGLAVRELDLALGTPEMIRVTAKGAVGDAMKAAGLDLTVSATSNEIGALDSLARQYAGQGVPALGALDAKAKLSGGLENGLAVEDVDMALGEPSLVEVRASGAVADAMAAKGLDLRLAIKAEEVGRLDSLARTYTGGQGVPEMGPLDLSLTLLGDADGPLGVRNLTLDFGREDTVKLAASGSVEDLLKGAGADLTFRAVSPDLSVLSQAAGTAVPAIGPLDIKGAIRAGADEPVHLKPFTAKIGDSDLSGDVTADLRGDVPDIVASFKAEHLDTADLTGGDASGGAASGGEGNGSAGGGSGSGSADGSGGDGSSGGGDKADDGRVIPDDPLPFALLRNLTADISFEAGKLIAQGSEFDDVSLKLTLKDGKLSVDPLKAKVGDGSLDAALTLDGGKSPAPMTLKATGDKLDLGRLGGAAGLREKLEGPLDLAIDLTGEGDSPRAIAGSLNGAFSAVVVDSRVKRRAVEDALGRDMAQLSDVLFGTEGDWVVVNCAVLDYGVENGVMDAKAGFVDTAVSTVTSDGTIDLNTEEVRMGVKPQTGVISIPLLVTGTLVDPSVIPDPGKTLLSVGGALLTGGGLTAALGVLSAALPADHPCMTTAEAAKKEAAEQETKSTGEKALDAPKESLKKLQEGMDGLSDGINKLLGQ